jgi:hypothetical protein
VIHDSYWNDIIRLLESQRVTVEGNVFYNAGPNEQHIDVNGGSRQIVIQDNIFFNDYAGSARSVAAGVKAFIVIKTSGGQSPPTGLVQVRRNIFMHYEGDNHPMLTIGIDDKPYFEAEDVTVENNLFQFNGDPARGMTTVNGSRRILFRANTIVGDAVDKRMGGYVGVHGTNNPNSDDIWFYNNIFSSPGGNMARLIKSPRPEIDGGALSNNLYFNGGGSIPSDSSDFFYVQDDASRIIADPILPSSAGATLPRWTGTQFAGGYSTIRQAFVGLVTNYAVPAPGSPAIGAADSANMPQEDILGNTRDPNPDIGAAEL